MAPNCNLVPPLYGHGAVENFLKSGRTVSVSLSPRDESLAVYATPNTDPHFSRTQNGSTSTQHDIYLAMSEQAPTSERRTFITDTSVIFSAFRNLVKTHSAQPEVLRGDEGLKKIEKLVLDYVNHCKECWIYISRSNAPDESFQLSSEHYRALTTCLSLFAVLYLPESGHEDAPVGDELMQWLNANFIEPPIEDGEHLSTLDRPWEDQLFWPYLKRTGMRGLSKASTFFLDTLSQHPSYYLQRLSRDLSPLISGHPRLHQFTTEREYTLSFRRWRDKVKTLRLELDRVPEDNRDDANENWWDHVSDMVGILEGRGDVLKRVCAEFGGDWKEVSIAWGVYVDVRLRRQDFPEVVSQILDDMPPDPTNVEDQIHLALFRGKPTQALNHSLKLDVWLAAHLADVMETLDLIDNEPNDSELTLREQYILSYTEYLHSDPGLWRITVDYLCGCGTIGKDMADQILMRVPLRLQRPTNGGAVNDEAERIHRGDLVGVLKEVNATCFEHQREEVRRTVCKIAAQTFLREKNYGLSISYYTSAEDWPGLGRVVDRVLEEYIIQGPLTFAREVAGIAPSLHSLRSDEGSNAIFIHRLMFAVRFAEFHQRRANGDWRGAAVDMIAIFQQEIVPKAWWAVLLCDVLELLQCDELLFNTDDAYLLLRRLEEISIRTAQGSGADYLPILARTTKTGGEKNALLRLQSVRLALARYYARCGVVGVGGKYV